MSQTHRQASVLPASDAQQQLWLSEQLQPGLSAYLIPMVVRLEGEVDVTALRDALVACTARHEALRTCLAEMDGKLRQLVFDEVDVPFQVVDLTAEHSAADPSTLDRCLEKEGARPFTLDSAPLLRATLLVLGPTEHVLALTVHHAVCDGMSLRILLDELVIGYSRFMTSAGDPLRPLPLHFGDWADWEQQHRDTPDVVDQTRYWADRLRDSPGLLDLPTDRPRPTAGSDAAVLRFTVPAVVARDLAALSRAEGCTLFSALAAGLAIVLTRHSGQGEVCLGTPVSTRDQVDFADVVGMFVNTVVLRIDTTGQPTFREMLRRTGTVVVDALVHKDAPFHRVVEAVKPSREPGTTPLFQSLITLERDVRRTWSLPNLRIRADFAPYQAAARTDLAFSLEEADGAIEAAVEYRTGLFDRERIARLVGHWNALLTRAATNPDRPVGQLDMLDPDERHDVLRRWNANTQSLPAEADVAELFREQVRSAACRVALRGPEGTWSYQELNDRASQLAHYLQKIGVGPEILVGVCLDLSPDLMVVLLAIIMAGGAYLPLDPSHPPRRWARLLDDAGAQVLVTRAGRASESVSQTVVNLDLDAERIVEESTRGPESAAAPANLAYAIYTSGSTGTPKGVMVSRRSLVGLVKNNSHCALGPDTVSLALCSPAFDGSLLELWGPLLNGGSVAFGPSGLPFLQRLREGLERFPVTLLALISPQLPLLLAEDPRLLDSVKEMVVGADVLAPAHARLLLERFPAIRVHHCYGPTEGTMFSVSGVVSHDDTLSPAVPLGGPISNTQLYVLGGSLEPQPIGVPGELYLAGEGLARGYLGSAAATAERFVANPYGPPGSRLYRTGDRARLLPGGGLRLHGRVDDQAKVRGYRVEMSEVESAIVEHPDFAAAAVVLRDISPTATGLVAYVVPTRGGTTTSLRDHLRTVLPEYMVPVVTVELDSLPLNRNGKVDREALPPVDRDHEPGEGPRTPTERLVAGMWRTVLGVEPSHRDERFLSTGGDSLRLMQLFQLLDTAFPGVVQLGELFDLNTLATQSAAIDARTGTARTRPGISSFEF